MTHDARESSQRQGAPLELLKFVSGAAELFYTTGDSAVTYAGDVYAPAVLQRGAIRQAETETGGELEVTVPLGTTLADWWDDGPPLAEVEVTLYRQHRGEAEAPIAFLGTVGVTRVAGKARVLRVLDVAARLRRRIPRYRVTRTCSHALYDALCGINPADFAFVGTVAAVTGTVVEVTGLGAFMGADATYFHGGVLLKAGVVVGYVESADPATDELTLTDEPRGVAASDSVTVYAGCDRSVETCLARFNNVAQFGGFVAIPDQNPHAGQGLRLVGG